MPLAPLPPVRQVNRLAVRAPSYAEPNPNPEVHMHRSRGANRQRSVRATTSRVTR
jgi:hypothetical protein